MVRRGLISNSRGIQQRPRHRNRTRHALREFLALPSLIAGAWVILAVITIMLDRNTAQWGQTIRHSLTALVPAQASSTLLSTITPGLLTVISIIFFVLLMAVQHQSATYSPVVLDQFLRRRTNQVFFGLFVGLTVYYMLPLTLLPQGQAIVSGTLAVALTAVTFLSLLLFVYATVDQIRPSATVWMLQQLALRAREHQQSFITRCHTRPQHPDAPATKVTGGRIGYVVALDGDLLARALHPVRETVEVELRAGMGDHLVPGDVLAEVRGGDSAERDRVAEAVLDAFTLGRMRDIDRDAGHATEQLANIAWSATATSGDPEGARIAVETLHGLLVRFRDDAQNQPAGAYGGPVPIIYHDRVTSQILDGLTSVIAASAQSGQHQTCSHVLQILSRGIARLDPDDQSVAVDRLQRVLPTAIHHVFTFEIQQAFNAIHHAMYEAGLQEDAQRINELKTELADNQRLATPAPK